MFPDTVRDGATEMKRLATLDASWLACRGLDDYTPMHVGNLQIFQACPDNGPFHIHCDLGRKQ